MSGIPAGLPYDVTAALEDSVSEAKRRGHPQVTFGHLAIVLGRRPGGLDPASDAVRLANAEAQLRSLRPTYETPAFDDVVSALVAGLPADGTAWTSLVDAVRAAVPDVPPAEPVEVAIEPDAASSDRADPVSVSMAPDDAGRSDAPALTAYLSTLVTEVEATQPVVGRDDVARRLLALLTSREPQTPLVVAPEGQGRTGLARCLAAVLATEVAPENVRRMPVLRVKPEAILANNGSRDLLNVITSARGWAIVYVDDVEVLCGLGSPGHDQGVLQVIRSTLNDAEHRLVLTCAAEFVDRLQVADRELFDELTRVDLPALPDDDVLRVAQSAAQELARYHNVHIADSVVAASVAPPRQIDSKGHPALAVARLDRAAAAAAMTQAREADIADLGSAVAGQQYLAFDADGTAERLKQRVLGQDIAIDRVANRLAITRLSLDLRPERPDGVFLFAGPTGTGKTELALQLANEVYGSTSALIRLDMSEYAEEYSLSKLVGSAPGYVGSTEPESWLTTKIRRRPQTILLLDEIEKAHPKLWNTFLQVFDAGRLTDSQGRVADFRDVIVVMTTNIGADVFEEHRPTGFLENATPEADVESAKVFDEIKRWMRPELVNRLDDVLVFRPLEQETVRSIVRKQLAETVARLSERGWSVQADDDVVDYLTRVGYNRMFGARPLARALESTFLDAIRRSPQGRIRVRVHGDALAAESA